MSSLNGKAKANKALMYEIELLENQTRTYSIKVLGLTASEEGEILTRLFEN